MARSSRPSARTRRSGPRPKRERPAYEATVSSAKAGGAQQTSPAADSSTPSDSQIEVQLTRGAVMQASGPAAAALDARGERNRPPGGPQLAGELLHGLELLMR